MRGILAAGAAAGLVLMLLALPAIGADLTGGCTLQVRSFTGPNDSGTVVDEGQVSGPGSADGTQSNPFEVNPDGSVDFLFSTGTTVFQNNHWAIYTEGLPVPLLDGSDDNPLDVDETGVVSLRDTIKALPFRVVGVFFVSGDLYGNNNTSHCHGEGYVHVLGNPVGTIPWDVAVALIVLAGLVLLVATPYSTTWETDPNSGEALHTGPIKS